MKATITTLGNMVFLNFFNSKEIRKVLAREKGAEVKTYAIK